MIKVDVRTINAFRRPSKSDKIEPRRDPATLADAHNEAGEVMGKEMMGLMFLVNR